MVYRNSFETQAGGEKAFRVKQALTAATQPDQKPQQKPQGQTTVSTSPKPWSVPSLEVQAVRPRARGGRLWAGGVPGVQVAATESLNDASTAR